MFKDVGISGARSAIKKEAGKIKKIYIEIPCNRNRGHIDCKNKSDTSNERGNWNHTYR